MKRIPKPFAVEVKKSRVPGERTHLPPKPLFGIVPPEVIQTVRTEEPRTTAQPAVAPRILPSIVEPGWRNPEPDKPIRRKQSSAAERHSEQIEFELNLTAAEDVRKVPEEGLAQPEKAPQIDPVALIGEDTVPVHEAQSSNLEHTKPKPRKPRTKALHPEEQGRALAAGSEPELILEAEAMEAPLDAKPGKASHRRQVRRQAAAARLSRSERWKRRLPPASW